MIADLSWVYEGNLVPEFKQKLLIKVQRAGAEGNEGRENMCNMTWSNSDEMIRSTRKYFVQINTTYLLLGAFYAFLLREQIISSFVVYIDKK